MKNPPHPGLSVRADCLEPLGLSVTRAAKALGVSRQALNNLINGQAAISPEMAIRLDKAFGGGAHTWVRLQAAYDLAQAKKSANKLKVQRITGRRAASGWNQVHTSLGFFDCLVLEVARKAGHLPLETFDRDRSKLDGAERL
jgi:antitoxin HigA-1